MIITNSGLNQTRKIYRVLMMEMYLPAIFGREKTRKKKDLEVVIMSTNDFFSPPLN